MNFDIRNFLKQPISMSKYIIFVTLIDMILYHYPLYSFVFANLNISSLSGILTFSSVLVGLFVVTAFILYLFAIISSRFVKFFIPFIMVGNSIALYFIISYQVILDKTMMGIVFNTNSTEAISYYNPKMFLYLFILGILPAYIISKIHIEKTKRLHLFFYATGILVSGVLIMYLNAGTWLWIDKYAKRLGGLALPWSYTINAIRYEAEELKHSKEQILLPNAKFLDDKKMIVVLVIGESARANNFSLYGYERDTNPLLKTLNVTTLKNAFSSSTYTTASVNSILSYEGGTSDNYEPLPNYLQRLGADVIWRTKNWGEPSLKIQTYERDDKLTPHCDGEGCQYDEVLLTELTKCIEASKKKKIFIILHTSGSHGPTYYTKYPKRFEVFKPVCKTVDLKECSNQELINAYDNTILYTDYFLSKVIEVLKQSSNTPSLMLYVSDHGESLGEYGLYLHGTPYSIAPDVQKKIPFIIWESESFLAMKNLSKTYTKPMDSYGQNNIFHTIIGAFGVNSPVYNKKLDILQRE
ncbi:MAG: phosphoethanolamine--lipid A transferase EptA [Sulfurimonas sp.]|uniref:phosphoethanolamine--lipid A transferase EptA n=1 Tax=Sulfurimonas sp. TaxID=2022749 RepID=UPI00262926BD|nr:phosphoethanolamine--lipid A transferase EptA [Sulfurimonas sp.]MDD5400384.1 phosphoethanolamine--lipid A transferase EptA [Sulfurimonas sp.]